jgi:hypothetical protein
MGVSVAFPGTWANGVPYLERTKNWGHGRHGTQWASLVSYGLTVQALKDFLPVDARLNERPVRHHTLAVAQRCPVGIAGGHGRDWEEKQRHFEVIAGKSSRTFRRNEEDSHPSNKVPVPRCRVVVSVAGVLARLGFVELRDFVCAA